MHLLEFEPGFCELEASVRITRPPSTLFSLKNGKVFLTKLKTFPVIFQEKLTILEKFYNFYKNICWFL